MTTGWVMQLHSASSASPASPTAVVPGDGSCDFRVLALGNDLPGQILAVFLLSHLSLPFHSDFRVVPATCGLISRNGETITKALLTAGYILYRRSEYTSAHHLSKSVADKRSLQRTTAALTP